MKTVREVSEETELKFLAPYAAFSSRTRGRALPEPECDLRTAYQRDRDRIIHSKAFRRLKHKTQVFLSPESDHYRTRLTHTLEVAQIARTVARAMRVNEDLTEAIALGHDLGHTPFGHAGERALNELCSGGFTHYEHSVRVCEKLERNGRGLNLTAEVLDGILRHTCGDWAATVEGRIVRVCDRIAYINHDIDDALRAGVIREDAIPHEVTARLGSTKSRRIDTLVRSLVENSSADVRLDDETGAVFDRLHEFVFDAVYRNPTAKSEESKVLGIVEGLYQGLLRQPERMSREYLEIYENEGAERAVTDYIAGMTDHFAVMTYTEMYVPKSWGL